MSGCCSARSAGGSAAGSGCCGRAPRRTVTWLTGVGFAVWAEVWSLLAVLLVLVVLPGLWARCWPVSFQQRISHPSWRRRIRRGVRRSWPRLMEACGLSRRVLDPTGATQTRVPVLHRVRWEEPDVLVTVPQLMVGQTVEDVVDRVGPAAGRGRLPAGPGHAERRPHRLHGPVPVRRPAGADRLRDVPGAGCGAEHRLGRDGGHRGRRAVAVADPGPHPDRRIIRVRGRRSRSGCC